MKSSVKLYCDQVRVRTRRELPPEVRGVARRLRGDLLRIRRHRRTYAGAHMLLSGGQFTPVISLYTVSGSSTETIPTGATTMTAELFGATGGGSGGTGVACTANNGTGGGSGGYAKTVISVATGGGKTIAVVIGTAGAAGASSGGTGGTGTASTFTAGTFALTLMTSNSGTGGNNGGGTVGGTASGGTTSNTSGNPQTARNQNGALGLTGVNANGNPGGAGGNPGSVNVGIIGQVGKGAFGYV